jgi:hypothetical protein
LHDLTLMNPLEPTGVTLHLPLKTWILSTHFVCSFLKVRTKSHYFPIQSFHFRFSSEIILFSVRYEMKVYM